MTIAQIPSVPGLYATSDGRIMRGTRTLKPYKNGKGYLQVDLRGDTGRQELVHRLIASAFFGDDERPVDHIDGVRTNNNIANLEYVTTAENNRRAWKRKKEKMKWH